jgi:FMN-dependent NADH-azoreductase
MATLLRIDASIRAEGSTSREVADSAQAAWQAEHPDGTVVHRELGLEPIPAGMLALAVTAGQTPADERTPEQAEALRLTRGLVDELVAADAYLLAAPLYNFGVPAGLKTWVDLVLTQPEIAAAGPSVVAGRPGVLVISRGGGYGAGTPREGWDHSTPWLQRIFADIFRLDLRTVAAELTLAGVVPAMAGLKDLAAQSLTEAHTAARFHGRELAAGVAA